MWRRSSKSEFDVLCESRDFPVQPVVVGAPPGVIARIGAGRALDA